jgi:hypothetical protein
MALSRDHKLLGLTTLFAMPSPPGAASSSNALAGEYPENYHVKPRSGANALMAEQGSLVIGPVRECATQDPVYVPTHATHLVSMVGTGGRGPKAGWRLTPCRPMATAAW